MHTENFDINKSERISIRLTPEIKRCIEQAASIDRRSITSFIITSAIQSAEEILKRGDQMVLSEEDWYRFHAALQNPPKASAALRKAFKDYKAMNIQSDV